jgi:hypothetical protein
MRSLVRSPQFLEALLFLKSPDLSALVSFESLRSRALDTVQHTI